MVTSDETKEIVSSNLQRIMRAKNISQGEIARRLCPEETIGVSHRMQVSRWVNGHVLPSSADVVNLADALGVTVADILRSPKTKKNL